ncbi:hypothetical protein [Bacillus velezensis]|uniref:hypothetical protein n=2 Tax=Bacillus velezensis TaxID=492670 RepID=UPI002DB5C40C|nr:hypothetical protein [Bacillus velezensis]MEC2423256.1 hypothetical protein [Bacillus velezensis]
MYPILVELVDNGFDWNILISLLGVLGVLYGAVTGANSYRNQKDREWTERSLNGVYAPLYQLICSQEKLREVLWANDNKFLDVPVINHTTKKNGEEKPGIIHRNYFIKQLEETDKGLASSELLRLIGEYKALVFLEEAEQEGTDLFNKITKEKVEVEILLVQEIVRGYSKLRKNLGRRNAPDVETYNIF